MEPCNGSHILFRVRTLLQCTRKPVFERLFLLAPPWNKGERRVLPEERTGNRFLMAFSAYAAEACIVEVRFALNHYIPFKISIKIFRFTILLPIFASMEIKKPESFWDVLIWAKSLDSDRKAIIILFNARMEDVSFEVDGRMVLYSLPDGRYLVLFRKPVSQEDFLRALAAFRTEVDDDEDAIGFYGIKPGDIQAYVSDLSGVCRVVPFDLDSASLTGAEPV